MAKKVDLIGQKFGKLLVLEYSGRDKYGKSLWKCRCSCGNEITRATGELRRLREGHCVKCNKSHNHLAYGEANRNRVYKSYQNGAQKRNLSFDLSLEEFTNITRLRCYYCGAEPTLFKNDHTKQNGLYEGNGIDRLDNTLGYFFTNCVPCCFICNRMKLESSYDEFLSQVHKISDYLRKVFYD